MTPENAPKARYNVPISLWFVEHTHRVKADIVSLFTLIYTKSLLLPLNVFTLSSQPKRKRNPSRGLLNPLSLTSRFTVHIKKKDFIPRKKGVSLRDSKPLLESVLISKE
jgi:hypothetical protein